MLAYSDLTESMKRSNDLEYIRANAERLLEDNDDLSHYEIYIITKM